MVCLLIFKFPIDESSLSESDFGFRAALETYTTLFVFFWLQLMKTEKTESGLLGEFGTAVTNPPVEVRVVGDYQPMLYPESLLAQKL